MNPGQRLGGSILKAAAVMCGLFWCLQGVWLFVFLLLGDCSGLAELIATVGVRGWKGWITAAGALCGPAVFVGLWWTGESLRGGFRDTREGFAGQRCLLEWAGGVLVAVACAATAVAVVLLAISGGGSRVGWAPWCWCWPAVGSGFVFPVRRIA